MARWGLITSAFALGCAALAQTGGPTEMSQRDEPATFQARVNLVMVPVVVRDRKGRAIGDLRKQDFQVFDKGKPQQISRFTVEKWGVNGPITTGHSAESTDDSERLPAANMPDRYVGYLFDDVHAGAGDLMIARQATEQNIREDLRPSDRAAIFTTSGQVITDFTDDVGKLHETLLRLIPRPIARESMQQCPDISLYQADMIVNHNDPQALQAAALEVTACNSLDTTALTTPSAATGTTPAQQMAQMYAQRVLAAGEHETRISISVLMDTVMRMAAMPGQRNLVLVSPGFYIPPQDREEETRLLDRAIRANVVINALNMRGLYTLQPDASQRVYDVQAETVKRQYAASSALAEEDILSDVAAGTGGRYFHNNNDIHQGLRDLTTLPEFYYLLGFQTQNLKLDGSFHAIKVSLTAKNDYQLQARHGYYAPRRLEDAAETAKREIQEALFSREEMHEIPVDLHTQFSRIGEGVAMVAVLAHLDLKHIHFKKAEGRNVDRVTVVASLFDRNGNYVVGITKTIDFHLKDETLQSRLEKGITVRTSLSAKSGVYMVRLVVRDEEGQLMSAANGAVDIP